MKILIFFIGLGLMLIGCKKNNGSPYQSQGIIIGYDMRECPSPACGGLEIIIKNDTSKNPPPFYHINSDLQQLGIKETTFPINVSLDWKPDTLPFRTYNYIIVTKIKVNN